jgi:hypothetical protein
VTLTSPYLIDLLRATLAQIELSSEYSLDDPAIQELRNALLRSITELSLLRSRPSMEPVQPVTRTPGIKNLV